MEIRDLLEPDLPELEPDIPGKRRKKRFIELSSSGDGSF